MTLSPATRFPILFTGANRSMSMVGLTPPSSWVDVSDTDVEIRMGWAFHLRAPRTAIASVAADDGTVGGWGVHGWRGRWLVNGSSRNLVRIEWDPAVRARTAGFPIRVSTLRVSMVDPDGLIGALRPDRAPATG